MLDRASTFADPEVIELLKNRFVPCAIDQWYQRRQQDAEGEFYRQIAGQGPRNNFNGTTQGLYVGTADGKFLGFNNNRGPDRVKRMMLEALEQFEPAKVEELEAGKPDPRFARTPPEGGLVIRVTSKVLGGYAETDDEWKKLFQAAMGRDHLWVRKDEHQAIVKGELPDSLARRIARFHLIDNTRGEPPMWEEDEIRSLELSLNDGKLSGRVHLETKDGSRGFEADLLGVVETKDGRVTRFDMVAKGDFWGAGTFTGGAPEGKFPFGVAFTLTDESDEFAKVPPQGAKGWLPDYIK